MFQFSGMTDGLLDTSDFFKNYLGYRYLITDYSTIEYYISMFHVPIFEEY